ncbi:MAG: DNA polymerase III subunit gamma/tau [Bacilli bacterium]|nr:DNA polymerase III subunit gamma/tau [Bacilli bacterium]
MSYKALYRTYRPSTFAEVAGQKAIVRTLQNALNQNKIAHAYLFSGPRGTGKTSMAKLFAKALNCEEGVGKQCNKCINCLGVNDGSHPDVYEIDAASNNGVEDVRLLIENINYAPIRGRYKVYIIDEVHMMTQSAFNALLKTLEEPPQNVIFILATTEPHKVIPTILSRCQRYNFSKVSDKDISERLRVILNTEDIRYEDEALRLLVSLADGGVRDALSMLDQVLAYADNRVNLADVLALFALTSKLEQLNLIHAITKGEVEKVFTILGGLIDKGVDIRRLTNDLLNIFKDALIFYKTENASLLLFLRPEEAQGLINVLSVKDLNMLIENFLKAQADYRFANDIKNIFEITLLKVMTLLSKEKEPEMVTEVKPAPIPVKEVQIAAKSQPIPVQKEPEIVEKVVEKQVEEEEELPPFMEGVPLKEVPLSKEKPLVETIKEPKVETQPKPPVTIKPVESENPLITEGRTIKLEEELLIKILTLADRDEKMYLRNERWDELSLRAMDSMTGEHAALLFDGQPYALSKEILIIEYDFARNAVLVNLKENQQTLQEILSDLIGRKIPIYAISHDESLALTRKYRSMSQIGKLPRVKSVKLELEGIY